ncbi:MAG: HAD family hydrolase [Clostridiales bacterium]|nr:HAD family hydrolase [Clostridiales bacterium]
MVQLVICDVDGTLVEDGGSASALNPEYYDIIEKLTRQGIQMVICSGRQKASVEKLFEPVKDLLYLAVDGGSLIFRKEECIYSQVLENNICKQIIEDARKIPPCDVLVCGKKHAYATSEDSEMYRWISDSYGFDIQAVGDLQHNISDDIVKISLYHHNMVEQLTETWFRPKWEDKVRLNLAGIQWLDCVPKEAGKGSAIAFLQEYLHISREETMVFGDNQNDIEMMRQAKYSFAVANAREEVKTAASCQCGPYWEDGVLKELKKLAMEYEK